MTTVKSKIRAPLVEIKPSLKAANVNDDISVEDFLNQQCAQLINDLQQHGAILIAKLRQESAQGAADIRNMMIQSTTSNTFQNNFLLMIK